MSELKYLTQSASGGNPIYITDLINIVNQLQNIASILSVANSYNTTSQSTVYGIHILSGFETLDNGQISPGYIYFNGDIYGFDEGTTSLTLGGYLVASKTTTSLRTTATGSQYYAYNVYSLTVQATQPQDTSTVVGAFTADNIRIWKTVSPSSLGMTIPNLSIVTGMLANLAVTTAKIASGAITADKIASGAVTLGKIGTNAIIQSNISAGAVGRYNITDVGTVSSVTVIFGDYIKISPNTDFSITLPNVTPMNTYGAPIFFFVIPKASISMKIVTGGPNDFTVDEINDGTPKLYRFDSTPAGQWIITKQDVMSIYNA